jgi:DNA-binding transcriptional regulator LsrR (DeoR family)
VESFADDRDFVALDLDRLTAQALRLSFDTVTLRDLFRVLWTKYQFLPPHAKAVPQALLKSLKMFYPYRQRSFYRLRHFVRKVLKDPRCEALLEARIVLPVDYEMGKELKAVMPNLKEVIVIPDIASVDSPALNSYLGLAAAQIFGPRISEGARVGIGGGRSVFAFAKALPNFVKARNLRFYALSTYKDSLITITDAEKAIGEMVVHFKWKHLGNADDIAIEGVIFSRNLKGQDLDWAFVGIGGMEENAWQGYADELSFNSTKARKVGAIAELLFHFFAADGTTVTFPFKGLANFETVSLSVLREMVRLGRPVVVLSGGKEKAKAILSVYNAGRFGGPLFNYLVTDEACAAELLRIIRPEKRLSGIAKRAEWWEVKNRFLVAHLKYAASKPCKSMVEISNLLRLPRKKIQQWLKEAVEGAENRSPFFSFSVRVPSSEFALEVALIRRYNLLDARVVPHFATSSEQLVHLGLAAAQFFCELLKDQKSLTVGIGSGYEVRAMIEVLSFPNILSHFQKLQRLEFWGLSESPMSAITQGLSTQTILTSIALRCNAMSIRTHVRCHCFNPNLPYLNLDSAFFTIRQPYEGDPEFLASTGMKCIEYVKGGKPLVFMLNQFLNEKGEPLIPEEEARCIPVKVLQTLVSQGKPIVALNARAFEEIEPHAEALRIACVNNIVNCLIIPRPMAEAILRK